MFKLEKDFSSNSEVPHEIDVDINKVSIAFQVPYECDINILLHDNTWTSLEEQYHRLRGEDTYEEQEDKILSYEAKIEELEDLIEQYKEYLN